MVEDADESEDYSSVIAEDSIGWGSVGDEVPSAVAKCSGCMDVTVCEPVCEYLDWSRK